MEGEGDKERTKITAGLLSVPIRWDYNGTVLKSGTDQTPLLITVNLAVASSGDFIDFLVENSVSSFGFDMTIYASGE
jgi:hypothetical protein